MNRQYRRPTGHLGIKERKQTGAHYTPSNLSGFVASQIVSNLNLKKIKFLSIADPAIGDGELLKSLVKNLVKKSKLNLFIKGFDIDATAVDISRKKIEKFPNVTGEIINADFINYVLEQTENNLFKSHSPLLFDVVIANPPYIRTQVLGAKKSQQLSRQFGLKGRVDLYHAFILGVAKLIKPNGILGIIVSNRFMTTKSGEEIRRSILELFDIIHIWDFGDTQLFEAAVLPAVLLLKRKDSTSSISYRPRFTSIYSVNNQDKVLETDSVFNAITMDGVVRVLNKGFFNVQQGYLDTNGVWKISNKKANDWIKKVDSHTKMVFSDVGKIRVGVKTTADNVFIKENWNKEGPELLRKLTTHLVARRYKPLLDGYKYILYTHETIGGVRSVIDINKFPRSKKYLLKHKKRLENRKYVIDAGRKWYEIWVPQDPRYWSKPKVVFRDISEKPTFWLDLNGTIVNGDCYWMINDRYDDDEILWLILAVANSTFIELFYDRKFNNKLYSGRRRFISQYVEKFPLPNPKTRLSQRITSLSKKIYDAIPDKDTSDLESEIDSLVWKSFGFLNKEAVG